MVFFLPAALLILIGWLIKYKRVTWLISGYNTASKQEKDKYDIEKLCKYMGNFLFILASVFVIMAITSIFFNEYITLIIWSGFIVETIATVSGIVYMNTNNRVKK